MKIKAYAIKQKNGIATPFSYERSVGDNEVSVRINYCGLARGDIQFMSNDWGDTKYPFVPGHEIIGTVEEAGLNVSSLDVGTRVGIGYQQGACFDCEYCKSGNEQFCAEQKVIGVHCYGGLADHIIVDHRFAFEMPALLESAKSIPLLSSGLTVYTGIIKAQLSANSRVGVLGAGGLGQLAIRYLNKMGHQVSAFSHSPDKEAMIIQSGATLILSSQGNALTALNNQFDFIISTVNAPYDVDAFLKMLRPQGKFCVVASPLEKQSISLGLLYDYGQRTIYGNYIGSRRNMTDMLDFSAKNDIPDDVNIMPFTKVNEAIALIREGKASARVVLKNQE